MSATVIDKIEKEQLKPDVTEFKVGDTVTVHTRVVEGGKERIQLFSGIVLGRKGSGLNQSFTVRKISYGEGVERVFPVHSPKIAKIEVTKRGKVRRAKLNYLRNRVGKQAISVKTSDTRASAGGKQKAAEKQASRPAVEEVVEEAETDVVAEAGEK